MADSGLHRGSSTGRAFGGGERPLGKGQRVTYAADHRNEILVPVVRAAERPRRKLMICERRLYNRDDYLHQAHSDTANRASKPPDAA